MSEEPFKIDTLRFIDGACRFPGGGCRRGNETNNENHPKSL